MYIFFSSESGRDNPFRPDGDISKEADEIVQLIKSGQPLDSSGRKVGDDATDALSPTSPEDSTVEPLLTPTKTNQQQSSPQKIKTESPTSPLSPSGKSKSGANGSAPATTEPSSPGTVEVTHVTVSPSEATHVEHVVIKKKSKCNCCVIQ